MFLTIDFDLPRIAARTAESIRPIEIPICIFPLNFGILFQLVLV